MEDSASPLAVALIVYVLFLFAIGLWVRRRVRDAEDFIVAGRRLSLPLASATLLATWIGAGTLLATADEVRSEGLKYTALEPIGPGICLILVALFFARPLWNARLLTANDLYRRRFGRHAEWISTLYVVGYFPWIAAQLLGAAGILNTFFGMDIQIGILLVALVACGYTLLGGMWSVTLTDTLQLALLVVGMIVLAFGVFSELGAGDTMAGMRTTIEGLPSSDRVIVPTESLREFHQWLSLFLAGTIGLIPSQDLLQRVFAARSGVIAAWACGLAGLFYLILGSLPVLMGLASRSLLDSEMGSDVIAAMAKAFMSPTMGAIFILGVASTILSSIDSGFLASSSVIAQNLLRHVFRDRVSVMTLTRYAVTGVTAVSVAFAMSGERAFQHLEASYSVGIAIFVVFAFAVYQKKATRAAPAVLVLVFGLVVWVTEQVTGWQGLTWLGRPVTDEALTDIPVPILIVVVSLGLYLVTDWVGRRNSRSLRPS